MIFFEFCPTSNKHVWWVVFASAKEAQDGEATVATHPCLPVAWEEYRGNNSTTAVV